MKRALALILAVSAGCARPDPPPAASCKPTAAVDLSAQLVGNPRADARCGLLVHAAPRFDADLEIEIVLPEGVTRAAGDAKWSGPAKRGETHELRLDFSCDGKRREIVVRATATAPGVRQTSVSSIVLNEDGSSPPTKGVRKVNSRGEPIWEFPSK
jgi:hypothetical protein